MKFNIDDHKPCSDGLEYYNNQPDAKTAWNNCPRGDWMLWIAQRLGIDEKLIYKVKE